jgi:hypothetical protein
MSRRCTQQLFTLKFITEIIKLIVLDHVWVVVKIYFVDGRPSSSSAGSSSAFTHSAPQPGQSIIPSPLKKTGVPQ